MGVPKIKRDDTKSRIINKEEIIKYIKFNMEESTLLNYKEALLTQTKVSTVEVSDLVNSIDDRLHFFNEYNKYKNDNNVLGTFYKNNINSLKEYFNELFMNNNIAIQIENLLTNFLDYCVINEENNIQNDLELQRLFDTYKTKFDKREFVPKMYFYNKVNDIMERKNKQLNRVDETAQDYIEPADEVNSYGGFILTSIIMEVSLILTLIISLILLFR